MVRFTQPNFCYLTISGNQFVGFQDIPLLLFFYFQGPSSLTGSLSLTSLHMLSKPHFQGPSLLSSILESSPPTQVSPTVYLRALLQCLKSKTKSQVQTPVHLFILLSTTGLPRWLRGKGSACQQRRRKRRGFSPWVGKIPGRRAWPPTPVF